MVDDASTTRTPHAPFKPWNPEWDAEMLRDWDTTSIAEFARRFGIPNSSYRVANRAADIGLSLQDRRNGRKWCDMTVIDLARYFARGRPSARLYYPTAILDRKRWVPRLAGRDVHNVDDPAVGFDTKAEAAAAAIRYRDNCRRWLRDQGHDR
jgi:hypothetical protein